MSPHENQLAYRQAAVCGASTIDLVIMLYDMLTADLQAAIAAIAAHDIETRSARLKHALLVLQQLEGPIDRESGDIAVGLVRLYSHMRSKILEAQIKQDATLLQEQVIRVNELRAAWVQVNQSDPPAESSYPIQVPPAFGPPLEVDPSSSLSLNA